MHYRLIFVIASLLGAFMFSNTNGSSGKDILPPLYFDSEEYYFKEQSDNGFLLEFIRPQDSLSKWTKMITVLNYEKHPADPRRKFDTIMYARGHQHLTDDDPHSHIEKLATAIQPAKDTAAYQIRIKNHLQDFTFISFEGDKKTPIVMDFGLSVELCVIRFLGEHGIAVMHHVLQNATEWGNQETTLPIVEGITKKLQMFAPNELLKFIH